MSASSRIVRHPDDLSGAAECSSFRAEGVSRKKKRAEERDWEEAECRRSQPLTVCCWLPAVLMDTTPTPKFECARSEFPEKNPRPSGAVFFLWWGKG